MGKLYDVIEYKGGSYKSLAHCDTLKEALATANRQVEHGCEQVFVYKLSAKVTRKVVYEPELTIFEE